MTQQRSDNVRAGYVCRIEYAHTCGFPCRERERVADMMLPAGMMCVDCVHLKRCTTLFSVVATNTVCDFAPSRFQAKPPTNGATQ